MTPIVPKALTLIPAPFDRHEFRESIGGPFSEDLADKALKTIEILVGLYLDGFSAKWYSPDLEDRREGTVDLQIIKLDPTYAELFDAENLLLPRFDPERSITIDEFQIFLAKYLPTCMLKTLYMSCGWLSKHANSRVDWPGAQHLLSLAEAHWKNLPEPVSGELVMCAAQVNRKRAFPVLKAFVDDPSISLKARNTATLVGGMIENPLDPAIFDMPKDP